MADQLDRLSRVFEQTAQLAEEHATRLSPPVDPLARGEELERARQARAAAGRARANANRLRERAALHQQASHPSSSQSA